MKFSFVNFPEPLKLSDYEKIEKQIIKYFSQSKFSGDLLSLYRVGTQYVPGISDLDYLVVVKDHLSNTKGKDYYTKNIVSSPEKRTYFFLHEFYIYPVSVAPYFFFLHPLAKIERIQGEEVDFIPLESRTKKEVYLYTLIDTFVSYIWRPLVEMFLKRCIDVRLALLKLNSLVYSFLLYQEISSHKTEKIERFSRNIKNLREQWFTLNKEEQLHRLETLFLEGIGLCWEIVERAKKLVPVQGRSSGGDNSYIFFWGKNNFTVFVNKIGKEQSIAWSREVLNKTGEITVFLPLSFAITLAGYSNGEGRFSRFVQRRLCYSLPTSKVDGLLSMRSSLFNRQAQFSMDNKILFTPLVSLGYFQPITLRSKLYNLFTDVVSYWKRKEIVSILPVLLDK